MRKMGKTGGRSTPSQDKASASNMADAPLTTEALVTELEKLRKTMTDELTTLLNTSLESIRSSVESIESTLVTQAGTIREMETSLTDHSDRITQIESEVCVLQSTLDSLMEENAALQTKVEDLESRSRRQNLRVLGLPEGIEGGDCRGFMSKMFHTLLDGSLSEPPELDRAHRTLQNQPKKRAAPRPAPPESAQRPRALIVRFHRFVEKDIVLMWAKSHKNISYEGHQIRIFEDFSAAVAKKRSAFNNVKGLLYKKNVKFGMIYPARLRVTYRNKEHFFNTPEDAETFYQQHISTTGGAQSTAAEEEGLPADSSI